VSRVAAGDSSAGTAAASRVAMSHDARVATPPRVFVMSDIHTDFPENMSWCASLSDVAFARDAVILGGDVSDDLRVLETTLRLFKRKFRHVFFTPGNHDLWIKGKGKENSEEQRGDAAPHSRASQSRPTSPRRTSPGPVRPRAVPASRLRDHRHGPRRPR
jgi:3',5'-cyclic AMP phosphodiesterase CpdA